MSNASRRAATRSRIAASVYPSQREPAVGAPHNTVTTGEPVYTISRSQVRDLVAAGSRLAMMDLVASALPGATPYPWVLESLPVGEDDI